MNYANKLKKIMRDAKRYLLYRGYSAEILVSGEVRFGDCFYPDKQSFRQGIDDMIPKRQEALMKSIEKAEKLLK